MKARRLFRQLAVRGMGYSGGEVGRYLGVTTSAVNRLAVSEELPDLKQYLRLLYNLRGKAGRCVLACITFDRPEGNAKESYHAS